MLVGCTPAETPSSETSSEYSDYREQVYNSITEEMSDVAEKNPKTFTAEQLEYYESILDPFDFSFGVCSVPGIDFKNPEQIPADSLINFYYQNGFEAYVNAHPTTEEVLRVPAEEVERFVQNYFDVSSEHLRTCEKYPYDNNKGTYQFRTEMGFGGFHGYLISNVIEDGDLLIFYCSGGASETKGCNAIAVQLTDDGFKYICAKGFMEYTE